MQSAVKQTIAQALFSVVFLGIGYAMHSYTIGRIVELFGGARGTWFFLGMLALTVSFLVASLLEKRIGNAFTTSLYFVTAVWTGVIFILFSLAVLGHIIDAAFRTRIPYEGPLILVAAFLLSLYAILHANRIIVKELTIPLRNLKKPLRAVQLTDIHVGTIRNIGHLRRIVRMTNGLKPDVVLITGDLMDGSGPLEAHLYAPLKDLQAPAFFSTGNHEFYEGVDRCSQIVASHGIKVVRNAVVRTHGVQIIGIDYSEHKSYTKKILSRLTLDHGVPSILLNHTPEGLDAAERHGIDLMLSGHTHNGQILPFNLLVLPFHRHIKGLYRKGKTRLYVSPGTGTWGPPMRLGSTNEITLFNLVPA